MKKDSFTPARFSSMAAEMSWRSKNAQRKAEAKQLAADREEQARLSAQAAEDKIGAEAIFDLFKTRVREAANAGKNWCDIMNLRDEDFHVFFPGDGTDNREGVRGRVFEMVTGRYTLAGSAPAHEAAVYGVAAFVARWIQGEGFKVEVLVDTNEDGREVLSQVLRISW